MRVASSAFVMSLVSATAWSQSGYYLQVPQLPKIPTRTFKLTDYGGVGDGKTMNTEAFAKAIDACKKAGGGSVVVPPGTYLTGPIKLVSQMALVVEKGAVIQASNKFTDFGMPDPLPATQSEINALKNNLSQLISGSKLTDVAIRGEGKIDGAGAYWWIKSDKAIERGLQSMPPLPGASPGQSPASSASPSARAASGESSPKEDSSDAQGSSSTQSATEEGNATAGGSPKPAKLLYVPRPHLIRLNDCERVYVQGVTLSNSPMFHFVPSRCREVLIEDVKIITPHNAPNTDGIDPSNCHNVLIRRCYIDTGDDHIALKGGGSGAPPMENITVTDCTLIHGHGVSIGSETNAGVRNFLVQKCTFENSDNGLRIKSDRNRGGLVENVLYRDITLKNVGFPITISLFYEEKKSAGPPETKPVTPTTPKVRNVSYFNVTCDGATRKAIELAGLPESPLMNIQFENVRITGAQVPMTVQDTKSLQIKNLDVATPSAAAAATENAGAPAKGSPSASVKGAPTASPRKSP